MIASPRLLPLYLPQTGTFNIKKRAVELLQDTWNILKGEEDNTYIRIKKISIVRISPTKDRANPM